MTGRRASPRATSSLELDERWARAAWAFLAEPRDVGVSTMLGECGAVEALVRLRAGRLSSRSGWEVRLPELDLEGLARAAGHQGVRVVVPGDPEWPTGLDRLHEPPYCLFVRGAPDLGALVERSVAIVGSRAATEYGLRVAADLADGLAARGFTVVSGAAYGVDSAAHRAALAAEGPTVAVLACGADRAYPTAHRAMLDQIARVGAVVSEVPVGCAPYRSRFLARNRIIATLARATVVVEANLRSGSLTTARAARDHHLPVGAVPGPVTSMTSAGCHALLRETDAVLVTDAAEVAELAARIGEDLLPEHGVRPVPAAPGDDLDPESYRVWSAVPTRGGATTDRLASASGVEVRRLIGILAALDAEGLVTRDGGRWRKKSRPTSQFTV
ncbi:MAG TPA: DNA-processing protein DprA [Ornithinibacter sp.]|nr:DNA-processing protein DprA [Ornithinibacter sp.]